MTRAVPQSTDAQRQEAQQQLRQDVATTNRNSSNNPTRPPYPAPSPTGGGKP